MISYNVMTLDAAAMLNDTRVRLRNNRNCRPEYRYDFNDTTTRNLILKNTDRHSDNALFYQIINILKKERDDPDAVFKSVVYISFKEAILSRKLKKGTEGETVKSYTEWERETLYSYCNILFEDGFTIVFDDGEVKTYIPFDKSGNMSRHFTITFIDKDIFEECDRRVRLDINFSDIKVVLSKYYAYRGLYLTDGVRIPENEEFVLNEKTVLVIEDDNAHFTKESVVTADKGDILQEKELKTIKKIDEEIRLNNFDGEGIISPGYADYINEMQRKEVHMQNHAASFQIRMPFIKGMLHSVDFHAFFKNEIGDEDYYIKDVFGIPRKLSDVQMVLTESMFKCKRWLEELQKLRSGSDDLIIDPMKWFFERFSAYSHALYICNTDANMGSSRTILNYQFLNTMNIKAKALDNMLKQHINEAHSIPKTGAKYAVDITEYMMELLYGDEDSLVSIPTWRYALNLNSGFVNDPYVKDMLTNDETERIKDVCMGRIAVAGKLMYLSGDLLALLLHILKDKLGEVTDGKFQPVIQDGKDAKATDSLIFKKLSDQKIRKGRFFVSDYKKLELNPGQRYSVWRNPHLSRSEQCALRAYVPNDEDNIYDRYFSHLKNIIMFSYESTDALALGGADFDGDTVKLILDSRVNDAVLSGAYIKDANQNFERHFPIVSIPSLGAEKKNVPKVVTYDSVHSTFSNRIGQISNQAIRTGKSIYLRNANELIEDESAACTLAAGLEIDSVKTGVRPNLSGILHFYRDKDYYLERKDKVDKCKDLNRYRSELLPNKNKSRYGGDVYTAKKMQRGQVPQELMNAEDIPIEKAAPVIDRLPGYFLKELFEQQNRIPTEDEVKKPAVLFNFQLDNTGEYDPEWAEKVKKEKKAGEKLKLLNGLIKAYRKIEDYASKINTFQNDADPAKYTGKIWTCILRWYDVDAQVLPGTQTSILMAMELVRTDFRNIFHSYNDVCEAIERMNSSDWTVAVGTKREEILYHILATNEASLTPETKELLLNNEDGGFKLLEFYLYEIRDEIAKQPFELHVNDADNPERLRKGSLKSYSKTDYEEYVKEYNSGHTHKESKKIWNARIVQACRDRLKADDMFGGDFDLALKYYYVCRRNDPNSAFLWDVFETNEIIRNVYLKPQE